jgi:membrane-bound metal-dependent hydrolase YbcI (DUF457 family)
MKLPDCVGNLTLRQVFGFVHSLFLFCVLLAPWTLEASTLETAQAAYFMAWIVLWRSKDQCGAAS